MLAYLFWHWPADGADPDAYARDLLAFHAALGLPSSHSVRLERAPFDGAPSPVFEDWYPVAGWAAIGELNDRAVTGARRDPHDRVAAHAQHGVGAIYGRVTGAGIGPRSFATWLGKPQGVSYDTFVGELTAAAPGAAIWQRQLVLGPAPEFAVLAGAAVSLPWPSVATEPKRVQPR